MSTLKSIAILGGTGDLGTGLARRWMLAGYSLIIGSRGLEKAQQAVDSLNAIAAERGLKNSNVSAMVNVDAAKNADLVVMTVPFSHQMATLKSIKEVVQGKVLVDVTVPLLPPKVARVQLPEEDSAAVRAQNFLGEHVQVVSAFQNVAAHHLKESSKLTCDVLVCGNKKDARGQVIALVEAAGMRGIHAGAIANSTATEALTSLLIFINKQYQCHSGIRITGLG